MHDMDHDGIPDMVVENDSNAGGAIEIHHGNGDGTFATSIEGGTTTSAAAGYGGHLAAIFTDPVNVNTQDILTATPIGLSLLKDQGGLNYNILKAIYNRSEERRVGKERRS